MERAIIADKLVGTKREMFKLILVTFILSMNLSFAQTLSDCTNSAALYGIDLSAPRLDENCKGTIISEANENAIDYSADNYIQAFGAGNILHTLYYTADLDGNPVLSVSGLTSGKFTFLNNIIALEIDQSAEQIYILNEAQDGSMNIVSLDANGFGARAAKAKLFSAEIQEAQNLKTDRANDELFVTGPNWIKVFHIDADFKSNIPERSIDVKRNLAGNNTSFLDIKDIAITATEIFVLDSDRILSFVRAADGDLIPTKNISGSNTGMNGAKAIDFNSTDGLLHITNGDDQILKFNTTDNGDLAPL